jgi:hypothetical protein
MNKKLWQLQSNFYGNDLASGVYLYQLRANNYVSTKKMVFMNNFKTIKE